jgi:hypothetical protein
MPTVSKFYERAIFDQLMEFLNNHFNSLLSAFRSGFGCQTVLLRIIEDWKKALDDNKFIAAILYISIRIRKAIVICIIINSTILNKVKNVIYKNIK